MGVYIKGMELPKDTEKVIVIVDTKTREVYTFPKPKEDIVNIREPHGRLIDGDVLLEESMKDGAFNYVDSWQIADAPTVIEGNEE